MTNTGLCGECGLGMGVVFPVLDLVAVVVDCLADLRGRSSGMTQCGVKVPMVMNDKRVLCVPEGSHEEGMSDTQECADRCW